MDIFNYRKDLILARYESLVTRPNSPIEGNGVYERYVNPVITAEMVPPYWKYDFNPETNPYFMERIGCNATLNSGAIKWNGKYVLMVRVEGNDRKSFLQLLKAPTALTTSVFGRIPSPCLTPMTPLSTSTTCA